MGTKTDFLPHVNGMRALAILAVVLYHLDAELCPCGYFGVDIFLLITGYFIFRGELSSARLSELNFGNFLQRKVWRLAPPVLAVAVPLVVVGAFVLQPDLYEVVLGTFGATCVGLGNEYVAHSGDYFSPATQDNPLMHLWYVGKHLTSGTHGLILACRSRGIALSQPYGDGVTVVAQREDTRQEVQIPACGSIGG